MTQYLVITVPISTDGKITVKPFLTDTAAQNCLEETSRAICRLANIPDERCSIQPWRADIEDNGGILRIRVVPVDMELPVSTG